jgi:hypothetical protein
MLAGCPTPNFCLAALSVKDLVCRNEICRVADLPVALAAAPLIVLLIIPICQGIGDLLPAIIRFQTRFHLSKQRLGREESSGGEKGKSRQANPSL